MQTCFKIRENYNEVWCKHVLRSEQIVMKYVYDGQGISKNPTGQVGNTVLYNCCRYDSESLGMIGGETHCPLIHEQLCMFWLSYSGIHQCCMNVCHHEVYVGKLMLCRNVLPSDRD